MISAYKGYIHLMQQSLVVANDVLDLLTMVYNAILCPCTTMGHSWAVHIGKHGDACDLNSYTRKTHVSITTTGCDVFNLEHICRENEVALRRELSTWKVLD